MVFIGQASLRRAFGPTTNSPPTGPFKLEMRDSPCTRLHHPVPNAGRCSKGSRHAKYARTDERQNHIRRDRSNRMQPGLAELALDVVFGGKTEAAVRLEADVSRFPRCVSGE